MKLLIGTSGWVYPHWRKQFYPQSLPSSKWLEFFSERFATVEVNNTFYRLPAAQTFASWSHRAHEGFVFAVKGSRYITHIKRLRAPAVPVGRFMTRARYLKPKLGPVLFQLPPRFHVDRARLEAFLQVLPSRQQFAIEFRDPSWHHREVYELLASRGVAYCIMVGPGLEREEVATADFIYVRFHAPDSGGPAFGRRRLRVWAKTILALCEGRRDAHIYFNNDAEGAALADAADLRELLGT